MKVAEAVRTCALEMLETDPSVSTTSIVRCAKSRFPECFEDEGERLADSAARRLASVLMKSLSEDEDAQEQLVFSDLVLPTAIAVPTADGDYEYVRTDKATWAQLVAGRSLRELNVERAQAKLRRYDRSLGELQPFMADYPDRTVAEAARLRDGSAA